MKVLFVDDDLLTAEWVTLFLQSNNIDTRSVDSISSAIQALADWSPDLIVTDLSLKDNDAFSLLKHLHENEVTARIPVIAVTGYPLEPVEQQRFHGFLMKPVEPDELLKLIRQFDSAR